MFNLLHWLTVSRNFESEIIFDPINFLWISARRINWCFESEFCYQLNFLEIFKVKKKIEKDTSVRTFFKFCLENRIFY